jgi:porphobilinogen deaminase
MRISTIIHCLAAHLNVPTAQLSLAQQSVTVRKIAFIALFVAEAHRLVLLRLVTAALHSTKDIALHA